MKILYIIPARGGSKGLPGKNIRLLNDKPLIAHSIDAAKNAMHQGTILVSTDDLQIAEIAKKYGASVPFIRPEELANDSAQTIDVIFHALNYYNEKNIHYDFVVLLQPTSPLRTSKQIDEAIALLISKNAKAVVSVCENEHHPLWSNTLPADDSMKNFLRDETKGKNRQQLPTYFRLNGAIYISDLETLRKFKSFIHEQTIAYRMPTENSIDIDHEIDFQLAELLLHKKK